MSYQITSAILKCSAAEKRNSMVTASMVRLQNIARIAMRTHRLRTDELVVVCIRVDSEWYDLVDTLALDTDWQIGYIGMELIAIGWQPLAFCDFLAEKLPDNIGRILLGKPDDGHVKRIALDDGGCTVYNIRPAKK